MNAVMGREPDQKLSEYDDRWNKLENRDNHDTPWGSRNNYSHISL
jgi:hypothetical protein